MKLSQKWAQNTLFLFFSLFKKMVKILPIKALKKRRIKKSAVQSTEFLFPSDDVIHAVWFTLTRRPPALNIFISAAGRDWIRYEQRFYFFLSWFQILNKDCYCFYLLFYLGFGYSMLTAFIGQQKMKLKAFWHFYYTVLF